MARRPDPKDPRPLLRIALSEVAGAAIVLDADLRKERAARILGISRVTLWRKLKGLGLLEQES